MSRISYFRRSTLSVVLVPLALCLAACGGAGDGDATGDVNGGLSGDDQGALTGSAPAPSGPAMPGGAEMAELQQLQAEFNSVQARLNGLQQQVMQDPTIAANFAALQRSIDEAVDKLDPSAPASRKRMEAIEAEFAAAEAAGDQAKIQALIQEGTNLQTKLQGSQSQVMQDGVMFAKMQAFQEEVVAAMTKTDPETPTLIARATEIAKKFQAQAGPPAGGPPPGTPPTGGN
jgi:hypothetical protein